MDGLDGDDDGDGDGDLERTVMDLLRAFSEESDRYVDAQGTARGLHRTHLYALSHTMGAAMRGERMTAGALGASLNLSPSATSALLDRLERAGHVVRTHDGSDRRTVTVEVLPTAFETGRELFAPLGAAIHEAMEGYDADELRLVARFLQDVVEATVRARGD